MLALALGVVATYLIVVSGNAKEAFAKVEAQKAEVRDKEASERIAQLGKDAAHLSADAEASKAEIAKANARAVEAQLALERFKAPRQIAINEKGKLIATLSSYVGQKVAIYVLAEGPDPNGLARSIKDALEQAGWKPLTWNWSGVGAVIGVVVLTKQGSGSAVENAALALAGALNDAQVHTEKEMWPGDWDHFGGMLNGPTMPAPTEAPIRVVIGSKPQ